MRPGIILALLLLSWPAFAEDKPFPLNRPEQLSRAGMCTWGHRVPVSTFARPVRTSTGNTDSAWDRPHLFPYGSLVSVTCDEDTVLCWAHEDAITTSTTGYIIDLDSTGPTTEGTRGCFKVEGSSYRDNTVFQAPFGPGKLVSQRDSACYTPDNNVYPKIRGYPCDVAGDCFYGGDVTCRAALEPEGAFLVTIASAATTCFVCIDQ